MAGHEVVKHLHGVIFEMLMANRIECVLLEHQREIALFQYPYTRFVEDSLHVCDKIIWIIKVIKHSYTGDHLRLPVTVCILEHLIREKVMEHLNVFDPRCYVGRVYPHPVNPCRLKTRQQTTIVATDVHYHVSCL